MLPGVDGALTRPGDGAGFKIMAHGYGAPVFVTVSSAHGCRGAPRGTSSRQCGWPGAPEPGSRALRDAEGQESGFWGRVARPKMWFPGAERAQELLNQAQRVRIPAKGSQRLSEPLVDGPPEPGLDVARGPGTDEPGSSPSLPSVPAMTALRRPAGTRSAHGFVVPCRVDSGSGSVSVGFRAEKPLKPGSSLAYVSASRARRFALPHAPGSRWRSSPSERAVMRPGSIDQVTAHTTAH